MGLKRIINSFFSKPTNFYKNFSYRTSITPSNEEIIFVIGAPRSGTTLIQSILCAHTKITGFSEETGFFMLTDFCKITFDGVNNSEYQKIVEESNDFVEVFSEVAQLQLSKNPGAIFFLEKTPQHVLQLGRLLRWVPKSKFINVYRDVRDSSISAMNFSGIEQGRDINKYLKYWNKCINARLSQKSGRILDVYYESFVSDSLVELEKIMSFIGLEYEASQLDSLNYSKNKRAGTPGFEKLNTKVNTDSIGKWKSILNKNQIKKIENKSGKLLKKIGYM